MLATSLPAMADDGLIIAVMAFINRAAGSDIYRLDPPGKPALYAAAATGLLVWLLTAAPLAVPSWYPEALAPYRMVIAWAVAYLFWRVWEHGRWIDLANDPTDPNRQGVAMTLFERVVTTLSCGHDGLALFWRHLTVWPGLVLVWASGGPDWLLCSGPPFAAALVLSHYAGRAMTPMYFHVLAELFHGAFWGALIIAVAS